MTEMDTAIAAQYAIHEQLLRLPKLAAALAKVQGNLPKLDRDRMVTVEPKDPKKPAYSYSYVTLSNLSDAILPLLAKHGLAFAALPGAGSDGKMCLRYLLLHDSGETLAGEFPISGEGGIQMIGGRITYARRYVLAALSGVAADEDDEARLAEGDGPRTAQRAAAKPAAAAAPAVEGRTAERRPPAAGNAPLPGEPELITQPQMRKMQVLLGEQGFETSDDKREFITHVIGRELASAKELTKDEAKLVIDRLEQRDEPPPGGEG